MFQVTASTNNSEVKRTALERERTIVIEDHESVMGRRVREDDLEKKLKNLTEEYEKLKTNMVSTHHNCFVITCNQICNLANLLRKNVNCQNHNKYNTR